MPWMDLCINCIVSAMRRIIVERLLEERKAKGALPSIREMARSFGASPQTVQKALVDLVGMGEIHVLERKGAFWGKEPVPARLEPQAQSRERDALERLGTDLRRGVFHPLRALPARKELSVLYGVSLRKIGQFLNELVASGSLERHGRSFRLPAPALRQSQGSVLVAVRCDESGRILLETEREIDFMKSVRREAAERDLRVHVVGCHEGVQGIRLLDPAGSQTEIGHLSGVPIGVIVSTWLVRDPHSLLAALRRLGLPISVWWEHAVADFRVPRHGRSPVAAFNLSFGAAPGRAVGGRMVAEGFRSIAWISPYHGNDWSRARLSGLREAIAKSDVALVECVDDRFHSRWHMDEISQGHKGGAKLLREVLAGFLDRGELQGVPAWVVVNDQAAVELLGLLKERGMARPRILSFDATSDSESYRFDSFEFHTEGMVRRMLHHLFQPTALLGDRQTVQEMVGRLLLRG